VLLRCRYLSEKLLSVLGAAYIASSRLVMEATQSYRATSRAAWEQHAAQHPGISDLVHIQVTADRRQVLQDNKKLCSTNTASSYKLQKTNIIGFIIS